VLNILLNIVRLEGKYKLNQIKLTSADRVDDLVAEQISRRSKRAGLIDNVNYTNYPVLVIFLRSQAHKYIKRTCQDVAGRYYRVANGVIQFFDRRPLNQPRAAKLFTRRGRNHLILCHNCKPSWR